jgi:O-succinylbenzoic acid--CoA ligase
VKLIWRGLPVSLQPLPPKARRIAIDGRNHPDTLASVLGAMDGGAEIALLNTRLTAPERRSQLAQLDAHAPGGEPATLLFTSGTTGTPKAAVLALQNHLSSARAATEVLEIDAASHFVCALPLFHAGGLAIAFRCLASGATLELHERFDAQAVARALHEGATHVSLVAVSLARVIDTGQRFPPALVIVGGGPAPAALLERARRSGLRVVHTWGMTETASMATCERPGDADGSSAGPALPGFELQLDSGEILVRGPAVMRGYLGHAPLSGWLRTGDLGELDARGRLTVHARRCDLIVSGGENVYPAEVEAALLQHPGVSEAAVLPAPDATWGQVGVAWVVATAAESELRAFLRDRLARYKIPARFVALRELPRNEAGKVDRLSLLARTTSPARP